MNRRYPMPAIALGLTLFVAACDPEPPAPKEPVKTEEQIRQEQEAARRSEQTAALAERAKSVTSSTADLRGKLEALQGGAPEALEAAVSELGPKTGEVERLLTELQGASGEAWEGARGRLETALADLERASAAAAETLADWQRQEQSALAAREEKPPPIDPATGLIRGLDGGDYEQYLVSVVVKVQERLRRQGRYAGPADGRFDNATLEAVGRFQEEQNLQVSGVPSPMTRGRLFE